MLLLRGGRPKTTFLWHSLQSGRAAGRAAAERQHGRGDDRVVRRSAEGLASAPGDRETGGGGRAAAAAQVPVLSGEKQPDPRWWRVFRVGQTPQRFLLLFPETRADVRRCRSRDAARPQGQGAAVAVRRAPEPGDTGRRSRAVRGGRLEAVQLGHAARPVADRRPPAHTEDNPQGIGPRVGVRRTAAVNQAAETEGRRRQRFFADKALQVVV